MCVDLYQHFSLSVFFFSQGVESISSDNFGELIKGEHATLTNIPRQRPKVHHDH